MVYVYIILPQNTFFFFSSRRRHTRSLCDWSSDVCSSDLNRRIEHENSSTEGGIEGERMPDGTFRFSFDDLFDVDDASLEPIRGTTAGDWPEGTSVTLS